ncbi:MAG: nucleotidyltransferase family protein [Acidobacteria bacterium]|nr:nucleotidyltransferase family protein [Acidobacteriota bacterium]
MSEVAAVLLAAGRSRRMGAFKPLLPFGGVTVAEACVSVLRAGGAGELVVVAGHRGEEVRAALSHVEGLSFAVNEVEGSEMGVSVARGVEALSGEAKAVLVALVDQPAVPPLEISRLIGAWRRTGARLVVPEWQGRGGHPLLADLSLREELSGVVAEKGLRALFEAHGGEVLRVPAGSPYVARDMDTWEDYLGLHEEIFGTPPPGL